LINPEKLAHYAAQNGRILDPVVLEWLIEQDSLDDAEIRRGEMLTPDDAEREFDARWARVDTASDF